MIMRSTIILLLFVSGPSLLNAQKNPYSLNEITYDLMIVDHSGSDMAFVWWMPPEYWQILIEKQAEDTDENIQSFFEAFDGHVVFAALKGEIKPNTGVEFRSLNEINENLIFTDASGNRYFPLDPEDTDYRMQMLFAVLKPAFSNMLGQYGQNIQFIVFDLEGESVPPKPTDKGRFYIKFFESDYSFRLPVGVFLPPNYCPVDGEMLRGDWNYCPYHGNRLTDSYPPEN